MWIHITHPRHVGVDRSRTTSLLVATVVQAFSQTAPARLLASFILVSAVLAVILR